MYHALVRKNGVWTSFGLHVPSNQWTDIFQTLQRAFGIENVTYRYWAPDDEFVDTYSIRTRAEKDIQLANRAQTEWDQGRLKEAVDGRGFDVVRGILILQSRISTPSR